jgi:pseudomonalisin
MPLGAGFNRKWRRIAVSSAGAGAMVVALGLGSAPAHASPVTGWAATHTQALDLNRARSLGATPDATPVSVTLTLSLRDQAALARMAEEASTPGSATYGHFLSAAQATAEFSPTAAQAEAVASWLTQAGFSGVAVSANRLVVTGTADAATVERAFDTTLGSFSFEGRTVYSNTTAAMVPARFAGLVTAVLGLNDVQMHSEMVKASAHPAVPPAVAAEITKLKASGASVPAYPNEFTPQQLAAVYGASNLPAATSTGVAVFTSGDMTPTIADLRQAEKAFSLPQAPVQIEYTGPVQAITENNPYTANGEWDLDTQTASEVAGDVKDLYIYDMPTIDDGDVTRGFNQFVAQDLAVSGSASFAECDFQSYLDGAMFAVDGILEEGAVQGQTLFAGTGDWGASCPVAPSNGVPDSGAPAQGWPADGTWTVAAGGTSLLTSDNTQYQEEIAWYAGGGGVSTFETAGNWTTVANPVGAEGTDLVIGGRGVPDLAGDADANTGENVYSGGTSQQIGGTSLTGPLLNALWAREQQANHDDLGHAGINAYTLYNKVNTVGNEPAVDPADFHDITIGTNGAYTALPGYDFTTGIGSPDAAQESTDLAMLSGGTSGQVPEAPWAVLVPGLGLVVAAGALLRRRAVRRSPTP